jgi:DNA-binding PadR family transcriptional regulator
MRDVGWLEQREEETGNRPPRRVYTITPAGRDAFKALLRESLAVYKPTDFIDHISLAFLDHLSPAETVPLLENRKAQIQALLHRVQSYDPHHGSMQLMVEHQIRHLEMEITWLEEVIERVAMKGIGMPGGTHHDSNE